jgi:ectoine hydroxylase-related dioxygenase (phytanoyl-CoA dioxygenase family)
MPVTSSTPAITLEDRFLFDLQGFILLKGVLSPQECQKLLSVVEDHETRTFDDQEKRESVNRSGRPSQPTLQKHPTFIRLNGLLRMDSAFDPLIAHPRVAPYLEAFMEGTEDSDGPQLGNTWSISKFKGNEPMGWHRGATPYHYNYRNGKIFNAMVNTVWFLTDNGPDDGCMVALPGGHKSNIDLDWSKHSGLRMPGAQPVTGQAGDVFIFSETVLHNGLAKTTPGRRTNLYFNYFSRGWNSSLEHIYHFSMPPSIRARFTAKQRRYTEWMDYSIAAE